MVQQQMSPSTSQPSSSASTTSTGTKAHQNSATDSTLVKDLANRLEALLTENGHLQERIKFLEEIVQNLTADLNRVTGKEQKLKAYANIRRPKN